MKKISTFLLALLLLVACTSDDQTQLATPFAEKQIVTISARVASSSPANLPGKHKVSGKDDGSAIELTWNEKDQILINVDGKESVFTITDGVGTNKASFTGEMPAAGTSYTAVYPVEYDETVLDNQTYVEDGFANGLIKMSTKTPGTVDEGFVMSADNSVLVLQLTGTHKLGAIVLTNTATQKFYTLDCTGVELNSTDPTSFYIVVPAGEWKKGFVVDVFDEEDEYIACFTKKSTANFVAAESMIMPVKEITPMTAYTGVGVFSVSATKQVSFAPGNLQYMPSRKVWRFAPDQTTIIGEYNKNLSDTYNGWVDLFGYSVVSNNFGAINSPYVSNYSGDFVDWGINIIGADIPNTWHTLSEIEWDYMLTKRDNAKNLNGLATVDGMKGTIILPNNYLSIPRNIEFVAGNGDNNGFSTNIFTRAEWKMLEQEGAIFLPVTGLRTGVNWGSHEVGFYRVTSSSRSFSFNVSGLFISGRDSHYGCAVRLAKELKDYDADADLNKITYTDGSW